MGRRSKAFSSSPAKRSRSARISFSRSRSMAVSVSKTAIRIASDLSGFSGVASGMATGVRSGMMVAGMPIRARPSFPTRLGHFLDAARRLTLSALIPSLVAASSYVSQTISGFSNRHPPCPQGMISGVWIFHHRWYGARGGRGVQPPDLSFRSDQRAAAGARVAGEVAGARRKEDGQEERRRVRALARGNRLCS